MYQYVHSRPDVIYNNTYRLGPSFVNGSEYGLHIKVALRRCSRAHSHSLVCHTHVQLRRAGEAGRKRISPGKISNLYLLHKEGVYAIGDTSTCSSICNKHKRACPDLLLVCQHHCRLPLSLSPSLDSFSSPAHRESRRAGYQRIRYLLL